MTSDDEPDVPIPEPVVVEYDRITGIPAEFNEYLPSSCPEYKRYKAFTEGGEEKLAALTLDDQDGDEVEQELPGGKSKKKPSREIVLEGKVVRGKKKTVCIIGLDAFGVKLNDAAKLLGKKFACGASVGKTPDGSKKVIDVQGDFVAKIADFLLATYADSGIKERHIYSVIGKKKSPHFVDGQVRPELRDEK